MGYGCLPCLLDSRAIELLLTKDVCLELMVSWLAQELDRRRIIHRWVKLDGGRSLLMMAV